MTMHDFFGLHVADLTDSHWDAGHFVTRCTLCRREMIKPPGLPWQLRKRDG